MEFLDWFDCQTDRELSPWREFYEELIASGVLNRENFAYVNYNYKGRIRTPIFLLQVGKLGFFQYDVFDLIPTDSQQKELEALYEKGNGALYKWVTEDQIQTLGYADKTCAGTVDLINPHTKWAHNLKYSTH